MSDLNWQAGLEEGREQALEQPGVIHLSDEEIEALLEALRHIGINDDAQCERCQTRKCVNARLEALLD